jgi:hypothetical protein
VRAEIRKSLYGRKAIKENDGILGAISVYRSESSTLLCGCGHNGYDACIGHYGHTYMRCLQEIISLIAAYYNSHFGIQTTYRT